MSILYDPNSMHAMNSKIIKANIYNIITIVNFCIHTSLTILKDNPSSNKSIRMLVLLSSNIATVNCVLSLPLRNNIYFWIIINCFALYSNTINYKIFNK